MEVVDCNALFMSDVLGDSVLEGIDAIGRCASVEEESEVDNAVRNSRRCLRRTAVAAESSRCAMSCVSAHIIE